MFQFNGTRKPDFSKIEDIDYEGYWRDRGFALRSKLLEREQIFFDWIPKGSKVLDIGCGNSRLGFELKTKKKCSVTAIDVTTLVTQNLNVMGIAAFVADIDSSDFEVGGQFDYTIISETLEHLKFPERLMKKVIPHTSSFVLSVPNSAFYRYRFWLMFRGRFFTQWRYHPSEHLRYWSHIDFLDWLKALDLEVVQFHSSNGFQFKDTWPNLFGHQICYLARTNTRPRRSI